MEKMTDSVKEHLVEQEITLKNKDKLRSGRKSSLDFRKYTKQIWLAGLGAFSRAEEEGNKLAQKVVTELSSHNKTYSHSRHIHSDLLKN